MPTEMLGPIAPSPQLPRPNDLAWIKARLESDPETLALLLFGSVARGDHTGRSDLDLAALAAPGAVASVTQRAQTAIKERFPTQFAIADRSKVIAYSADTTRKVDLIVVDDLKQVVRYVAGSRIPAESDIILFDRTGTARSWAASIPPENDDLASAIPQHVARFASHFERASAFHSRNDMYRARFNLESALHCVAYLEWRAAGQAAFAWLPRDLIKIVPPPVAEAFRKFEAPMDPSRFHPFKVLLLSMFRTALGRLNYRDTDTIAFCQQVLNRDRWWNYRDAAVYTDSNLARGVLIRSSSPQHFMADPDYLALVTRDHIAVRIDLRGAREKLEAPVHDFPSRTIEAPVDPWNDFRDPADPLKSGVDKSEASYRFTALRCPHAFRAVVESIAEGAGAVLVHCFAGVDRTGVIVALTHLLAGVGRGHVLAGYSASSDAQRTGFLDRTLSLVEERGGVEKLAADAGLTRAQITAFRSRMWA